MSIRAKLMRAWREWLRTMLVIVLAVTALRSAVADWNDVPTGSMKPTILEGDRIVVNKLAYDLKIPYTMLRLAVWGDPARGDIVVLRSPGDGTRLVKRVVAVPGDRIEMRAHRLVVNDRLLEYAPTDPELVDTLPPDCAHRIVASERFGDRPHHVMITPYAGTADSFPALTLDDGEFFVMGDNRDESLDSRFFGPVERHLIVGRATAVAASVNPKRSFLPRWRRFFTGLR